MAIEEIQAIEEMNENNGQSQIGDDFYETIEAPKFVDLNAPDHRAIGDDRYWFCERVGCDQKHEEEMDSELIYKDFVLRVMASRSPSVRFRRTLCKKDSRTLPKCPNTVPPKPLRSRISKLAMISSIPQKTTTDKTREIKGQIMSAHKHEAKRKGQESSIEAKAFTTPGKQNKHVLNPGSFRSVRNVRTEELRVSKNRIVAKALVFHSPKKTVKLKRSVELRSSKKKICNGMRKQEKRSILGFNHKLVPLDQSRKPLKGKEAKSRAFDSSNSQKQNGVKVKNPETLKERVMENEEELSQNKNGESWVLEKYEDSNNNSGENDQGLRPEPIVHEAEDPPAEKESDLEKAKHHEASETEGKKIALAFKCSVKEDVMDPEVSNGGKEEEAIESDDKENAFASDINRKADHVADPLIKRKDFGKKGTCKTPQKVATTRNKCSNGKPSSAGSHAQGVVKYTKPKPTNPKPFRLRTDERHILKEANTERKQHQPSAKEEMMSFLGSNVGNLRQKHEIQQEKRNPGAKVCKGPYKLYPRLDDTQDQEEISEKAEPIIRKQTATSQGPTSSGRKKRTPMKTPTKGLPEGIITEESKEVATVKPSVCVASGDKRHATTVPRGPNFHSIHIPKNCTKRLALEA